MHEQYLLIEGSGKLGQSIPGSRAVSAGNTFNGECSDIFDICSLSTGANSTDTLRWILSVTCEK